MQDQPQNTASPFVETCETLQVHTDVTRGVHVPSTEEIAPLADLFRAYADTTRLKIIMALSQAELCVCDLCSLIGMEQSAVSHQLASLKGQHIVKGRRQGKSVYYSLDDNHISQIFTQGLQHTLHTHSQQK